MTVAVLQQNNEQFLPREVQNILDVLAQIEEHTANIGRKLLQELNG